MQQYILAHDVGTGGNKAVLVDTSGRVHGTAFEPYKTYYPKPGWAEQEPDNWWKAVAITTGRLLEKTGVSPKDILCLTFSTQMLGIVPMDSTGPIRRAIIWLDSRAAKQARAMMRRFISSGVFALIAGAPLGAKDGMPKLLWLKEEEPDIYARMDCFVDVAGYLVYRSTGRMVMDWTEASVFGLDLKKKTWLKSIFKYVGIDPGKLPPLVRSIDRVGGLLPEAARDCNLLEGMPVVVGAGDAPSAAVGSGAVSEGDGHVYLGTSGWVGVVTERTPTGRHGVAAIHSADPDKAFLFAESETAGACLEWIAAQFYRAEKSDAKIPSVYALMDKDVERTPPGSGYLIFTPWMYGERAPIADTYVRSTFLNLSADHSREHLLRAVYEGVAYNLRWVLEIVEKNFHFPVPTLRVIGGGALGAPWMQILADVTQRRVETVADPREAGAIGAALTAAVGLGIYPDFESLKAVVRVDRSFETKEENAKTYDFLFQTYKEVYRRLREVYIRLNKERLETEK